MVITYADYAPIRAKLSYGPIRNCNRKTSAIMNLEAWFASENLRRLHQEKYLKKSYRLILSRIHDITGAHGALIVNFLRIQMKCCWTNLGNSFKLGCKAHTVAAPRRVEVDQPRFLGQHHALVERLVVQLDHRRRQMLERPRVQRVQISPSSMVSIDGIPQ